MTEYENPREVIRAGLIVTEVDTEVSKRDPYYRRNVTSMVPAILCPHGQPVPLRYGQFMPDAGTRGGEFWCVECERQRAEGRAQDARIKAALKVAPTKREGRRKVFADGASEVFAMVSPSREAEVAA